MIHSFNHKLKNVLALLLLALPTASFAQYAVFHSFSYKGLDSRFNKSIDKTHQYFNPIVSGFHPDPSVCRVGDDYYLVNSSFSFYPGVPIFKSKDLVNWKQLGYVLDRPSILPLKGQGTSAGIYAPDIKYNKKNKTFYMVTSNCHDGGIFYVTTKNPEQGWSERVLLPNLQGNDPAFFFDNDGKAYIVYSAQPIGGKDYDGQLAIHLKEFDLQTGQTVGDVKEIIRGGSKMAHKPTWAEGPHLFRKGGYYYLLMAEDGTDVNHSEVIFRSRSPWGPYEEFEDNPILTQRDVKPDERPDKVGNTGHADLVEAKDGSWWAVFLGVRPYEGNMFNTGRETFMLPVTWKDGWPRILEHGKAVPTVVEKKGLKPNTGDDVTGNISYTDNFNGKRLDNCWVSLRYPVDDFYQLTTDGLVLKPNNVNIYSREPNAAVFTRQKNTDFEVSTSMSFVPTVEHSFAGMALLQCEPYNILFGKALHGGRVVVTLIRTENGKTATLAEETIRKADAATPLWLKVVCKGRYCDFYFSFDGKQWQSMAAHVDASCLSTAKAAGFTGCMIGLHATLDDRPDKWADDMKKGAY